MTKAAVYARKSTEDPAAASVVRQVEHARAFAERKGWSILEGHVFVEDGVSGGEFRDRRGLLRLLNAARSTPRPFDVVVMAEASRLGRDRLRTELVARYLHERGVVLGYYGTGEQERLDTPEERFVLAARSFAAELERAKAKERTRDAHAPRARKGTSQVEWSTVTETSQSMPASIRKAHQSEVMCDVKSSQERLKSSEASSAHSPAGSAGKRLRVRSMMTRPSSK
jgi:DNA invertase Pin-like site-specific DNA recombinase